MILKLIGVERLKEILRSQRLRRFVHIERINKEKAPTTSMTITAKGKKKGRPKKQWMELVEEDMRKGLQREQEKTKVEARQHETFNFCQQETRRVPYFGAKIDDGI